MYDAYKYNYPCHLTFILYPPYLAKYINTAANINAAFANV